MFMTESELHLADRMLINYLNHLVKVGYIDRAGRDFFFELASINKRDAHTFIVEALVDFVIGLSQEPEQDDLDLLPTSEDSIH